MPENPPPADLARLTGDEPLGSGRVIDFWRWALGDLQMNNTRGHLAEYLVAQAVGDTRPGRIEWDPHDVLAPDGTRIEVKATGRLQSWKSPKPTPVEWKFGSIHQTSVWSEDESAWVTIDPRDRVDVWVFALQAETDPAAYDPLALEQWEFRALAHRTVIATGQKGAALSTVERLGGKPVPLEGLAQAVAEARRANDALAQVTHDT